MTRGAATGSAGSGSSSGPGAIRCPRRIWRRPRRSPMRASPCTRVASAQPWYEAPHWYSLRPYAWAIAAEVAVVARLPDAASRLAAAAPAGDENYWAAACLARAAGQLHGDRGALERSIAGWERIAARFERACTLTLLPDRADEGLAELRALGCRPPAARNVKTVRSPLVQRRQPHGHDVGG